MDRRWRLSTKICPQAFLRRIRVKDFYVENGKLNTGLSSRGIRLLITLNKWYKEGLLDKNFASADTNSIHANVLSDKTGAIFDF